MNQLIEEVVKQIQSNDLKIYKYYQKDYEMMIRLINDSIQDNYTLESVIKLWEFDVIKEKSPKLLEDISRYHALSKFVLLFDTDFVELDIDEFQKLENEFPEVSFPVKVNDIIIIKRLLSDPTTLSKQPLIDNLNKLKERVKKELTSEKNKIDFDFDDLIKFLEKKKVDQSGKNIVELIEIDKLEERKKLLDSIKTFLDSGETICSNGDLYKKINDFIVECSINEEEKLKLLKEFYLNHLKVLSNKARRNVTVVNHQVEQNSEEIFNDIRNIESDEKQIEDNPLVFEDLIDNKTISQLNPNEIELYNEVRVKLTKIIDEANYSNSILCDVNLNEMAQLIKDEDESRECYLESMMIKWEYILVDLFQNSSDKEEFVKILNGIIKAIRTMEELEQLGITRYNRSQKILEIEQELNIMNNKLFQHKKSSDRDTLIEKISLLLSDIGSVNEHTDDNEYKRILSIYNEISTEYNNFTNISKDKIPKSKEKKDSENFILFSPNFISQCQEFHAPNFYKQIESAILKMHSETQFKGIRGKRDKYIQPDRNSNGIASLKTTDLHILVTNIKDSLWYVCGVEKKIFGPSFEAMIKSYASSIDSIRDDVRHQIDTGNIAHIIKRCDMELANVLTELSKWNDEKNIGGN